MGNFTYKGKEQLIYSTIKDNGNVPTVNNTAWSYEIIEPVIEQAMGKLKFAWCT